MSRTNLRTPSMATQARHALETLARSAEAADELVTLDALAALGESYTRRTAATTLGQRSRGFVTALVLSSLATHALTAPLTGLRGLLARG